MTQPKFNLGDLVRKTKGSQWSGAVVGIYSTELTPEGYAVESSTEKGSVQIYPAAALEAAPQKLAHDDHMQQLQEHFQQNSMLKIEQPMNLNDLSQQVHAANINWWRDPQTSLPIQRNKGELLALIHSEISEALEGERKDLMDDKLPHRKMAEVELADAVIRILDYCGGFGYDLQGAFEEKMAYNSKREDHKHAARMAAGGKKW
jgi:hypothetical protein